jgi:hypothetical protein
MKIPRSTFVFLGLMTAVAAFADPTVRPRPAHNEGGDLNVGTRAPNPWTPVGKAGYWVFRPNPLGLGLPWVRDWVTHPHEEDVPEEPGDVPCADC